MTEEEIIKGLYDQIDRNEREISEAVTEKLMYSGLSYGYYYYKARRYGLSEELKQKKMGNFAMFIPASAPKASDDLTVKE